MATKKVATKATAKLPSYKDAKFVFAETLKKPYLWEDADTGNPRMEIVLVTGGRAQIHPCTDAAFKRVNGKRFKVKPHSGLWRQTKAAFLVAIDKTTKNVIGVDMFPAQLFGTGASGAPTYRINQPAIKLTVDAKNGDITILELPPKTIPSKAVLTNLLRGLHQADSLEAGDTVKGYEITNKEGTRLTLEPVTDPDEGEEA